jgi:hypothetical protein
MLKIKIYNDKKLKKIDDLDERQILIRELYRKTRDLCDSYEYNFTSMSSKIIYGFDKRKDSLSNLISNLSIIQTRINELEGAGQDES